MRQMALNFAAYVQPELAVDQLQEIAEALNGDSKYTQCNASVSNITGINERKRHRSPMSWNEENSNGDNVVYIYVDYVNGDDSNHGDILTPFKHISTAITKSRSYGVNTMKYIILREGKHYLEDTIELFHEDSNMVIRNYNNEKVEVTGALPVNCFNDTWTLYKNMSNNLGIYTCVDKTIQAGDYFYGLRVNSSRGIRARYPNANPELGFGSSLKALSWLPPKLPKYADFEYNPLDYPIRNTSIGHQFWYYLLGMGGPCQNFEPQAGYWCSSLTQGGGGGIIYTVPSGLTFNKTLLPNSPYSNAVGGLVHTWRPGHWSTWMFNISSFTNSSLSFDAGGFQGARGSNSGDEFYVENIFEELDYPTEFFWNSSTNTLYYYNNITGNPSNLVFERTNHKVLFSLVGSMSKPVSNVSISGLTLRDTAYTYMDPHSMPSGGDWALQRTGAVYLDGVENVSITNNFFTRLDGNSVSVNRYSRNVNIISNEFVWNGDNVISAWGDTEGVSFPSENTNTTMGYDGTTGNQPRGLVIHSNLVHEIGIWEKQSSFYFQSKSCLNTLTNNIFYNGPRAGINVNDGFGGGTKIQKNLLFNTCRESGDHGPFNSWDRQPYVTKLVNGTPSTLKLYDIITQNFILANYNSQEGVDNDDGSCYYKTYNNFMVYGSYTMKSDFGGHDNHHFGNIYAYVPHGFGIHEQLPGHNDLFVNNTVVFTQVLENYGLFNCSENRNGWPILGGNNVSTPSGDPNSTGLCNMPEKEFQEMYKYDYGTQILEIPSDEYLFDKAYKMLWN